MMTANKNALKVAINSLQTGMYVSNLDRPWLETPYLIQGILIQSQDDINELKRHCSYVYVDMDKSESSVIPPPTPDNLHEVSKCGSEKSIKTPQHALIVNKMQKTEALKKFAQEMLDTPTVGTQFHGTEVYTEACTAKEELPAAMQAFDITSTLLGELNLGIERSTKLDVRAAQEAVDALRESVLRNPDAALLLARLKTTGRELYDSAINLSVHLLALGRHMGLPRKDLSSLGLGGLLMDIGKLSLPLEIQIKNSFLLNASERKLMKQHVVYGEETVALSSDIPEEVSKIVTQHHERENGCGYPRGLFANQIHAYARMAAIVDCYEELITARPNMPALTQFCALKELRDNAYSGLNPVLVEQFAYCIGIFPVGSLVELNTGEVAIVLTHNRTQRFLPRIMIIFDEKKQPYDTPLTLDLKSAGPGPGGVQYTIVSDLSQGAYGIDAKQYYL